MRCHMESPSNQKSELIFVFSHQFIKGNTVQLILCEQLLDLGAEFLIVEDLVWRSLRGRCGWCR